MNKKKILLLINNIQNNIDALKLELDEEIEPKENSENVIPIQELIKTMYHESVCDQFSGVEKRGDGPDILLKGHKEKNFYERFNLGDNE